MQILWWCGLPAANGWHAKENLHLVWRLETKQRQVAEVVESTIQDGVTVSTTRKAIYKNTEERNHGSTTTWGEAYYCTKCHMRYEYTRKEHSSRTESRDLESDGQALNRNSWGAH